MDVPGPSGSDVAEYDEPVEKPDRSKDYDLPYDDREPPEARRDARLELVSVGPDKRVEVYFDKSEKKLVIYDPKTRETQSYNYYTNEGGDFIDHIRQNVQYDEVPEGKYAILQVQDNQKRVRLEAYDDHFGDDRISETGQTLIRMHGPSETSDRSFGCVTTSSRETWVKSRETITDREVGKVEVESKSRAWFPGGDKKEILNFYGDMYVY